MQLHVRRQARALDCVCSIISSRLHVRVKTYVYRVLWCKSCEAWHEVLFLLLLCARRWSRFGRITNFKIVFLILSIRPEHSLRFNRETLRFKWIKLYISNTHLTRLSDFYSLYVTWRIFESRIGFLRGEGNFDALEKHYRPSRSSDSVESEVHRDAIIRGEEDYFAYSRVTRGFFLPGSLAGLKSGDEKVGSFTRLSDPRGCTRSCRRSQDAEDAEERAERTGGGGQWNWNGESGSQNRLA